MKDKIKELSNKELIDLYRLLLEHLNYLNQEKEKLAKEDEKWLKS